MKEEGATYPHVGSISSIVTDRNQRRRMHGITSIRVNTSDLAPFFNIGFLQAVSDCANFCIESSCKGRCNSRYETLRRSILRPRWEKYT